MENQIKVERDTYEKDGKTYYSYFIKGNIRGRDIRVLIVPPDKGGYTVLDIVFGEEMEAELVLNPYEIKDESTGKVQKDRYGGCGVSRRCARFACVSESG